MNQYVPTFYHLFNRHPEDMTYMDYLNCRQFADDWIRAQGQGG